MFKKVLIANRGAIATRIMRTLKKMNIASVALASDADRASLHVQQADEVIFLKGNTASETYLNVPFILAEAKRLGVDAVHPGYGFLSENTTFASDCEAAGITFIGPTNEQIRDFGLKHTARELAIKAKVPLLPGSGLLDSVEQALSEAERIGYPVMLKSTAGGGGIGMQKCDNAEDLNNAFEQVKRLSQNSFGQAGLFLEKFVVHARHIEIQIFGDGQGNVVSFGERDCSLQRRNQKVVEETPAPGISREQVQQMEDYAIELCKLVNYKSAGTVEYVYDADSNEFYFLEVNTRLQVEHGITETVRNVDLVEWMIKVAYDSKLPLSAEQIPAPQGHAIEVRVYAEDPFKNFQPSAGKITGWQMPSNCRVDTWCGRGIEVSSFYDPMMAKIIVKGESRESTISALQDALHETQIHGFETNVAYLEALSHNDTFKVGAQLFTQFLNGFKHTPNTIEVTNPGTHSMLVSYPGRVGYWDIGVPPSGPMDALSHRLANRCLNNPEDAATIEMTVSGISMKFDTDTMICITGADIKATLDKEPIAQNRAIKVKAGQQLKSKVIKDIGQRAYLAVLGGFDVPDYMGSKTTFSLGGFGGHGGRLLRIGDVLRVQNLDTQDELIKLPDNAIPTLGNLYEIAVIYGPQGCPDFFTEDDIENFFSAEWKVHYNSSRTGIRLIGPKPQWARNSGGEAGLHPSNIHDNPYAIGAIDFTGDMPVILAQDGPSLGGFVCPATIIEAEQWKMGQLRPGDKVKFKAVSTAEAERALKAQEAAILSLNDKVTPTLEFLDSSTEQSCIAFEQDHTQHEIGVKYRRSGDSHLLIEYGAMELDLALRFRIQVLFEKLRDLRDNDNPAQKWAFLKDLTPGIRSLQVHYDPRQISQQDLLEKLIALESEVGSGKDLTVKSRIVHLPLSWDDPSTRLAIEKYMTTVRPNAPWCPSNIEFIRRINGLDSIEDVKKIVFNANYLVMGLGDVYLGAPVATPLDPRHRLVTTKYNPARTWTPENAVGIGGAYMCVYGMEGPGGYQFVGRTIQMWNAYFQTQNFSSDKPWLLDFFDQIKFYPVSEEELKQARLDFPLGRFDIEIEETELSLNAYQQFLAENDDSIGEFQDTQQAAFEAERLYWEESGLANFESDTEQEELQADAPLQIPEGFAAANSPITGSVWKLQVKPGDRVEEDQVIAILETMKIEIPVNAEFSGTVSEILVNEGDLIQTGQALMVLKEDTHA
ncbi:urea carboxylase [Thiomicrorhabdus sediminis]|uniref:Urea carboxylase n=1 Tax=Thiomicrorhabdus sediminis TaxID=2580412 RepID=A0A4P9K4R1_9GAMM|nr:urea carboxylase [Thiomicrorhabdus sediminis]QCU89932.1 urea carboxylase [Thiomicrorhabdus sediminis]